uniref:Phosphopantetheine attachment site n=1 Tax=Candidatus Kentrum sp. LPFa TaxID=2126335 RepID=A0A450WXI4_9GAMM|nr:MAG: Phosphopantetheine attachment site [Candidatus Kentron sp. LPFa]VFK31130.1 MAG: Phosphopantetheine attachment site [Candidatus Kentron sp. LPFa]
MIPAAFVVLEKLPLTPNGKIDRHHLPTPDPFRRIVAGKPVAPRTPVEKTLTAIWTDLLELEEIGIHDDFFALGGDSLLFTQVVSRVREGLRIECAAGPDLFEHPTIAEFAHHIETIRSRGSSPQASAIQPISQQKNLPLSYFQETLWWLSVRINPESPFYNESFAVHINTEVNITALECSLDAMIERHGILRTNFTLVDGQPVQNIMTSPPSLELSFMDLGAVPEEEREAAALRLANEQAKQLFDLAQSPSMRAILIRMGEARFELFVTLHHIIIDGFSLYKIFMPELIEFYQKFSTRQSAALPELSIQYADFSLWQRQQTFETQLAYWKTVLGDEPPLLQLPTDHPHPVTPAFRGAKRNFTLSRRLTARLERLSGEEGVTLFMTLLAAFNTLLHRYTGQDDLVIGGFADCRNRSEFDNTIGYFLNPLVLRTDMSGNPTFGELLARARKMVLGAYSHRDLPFQQLVEILKPARHPGRNPFFEVALTLEPLLPSVPDPDWELRQYDDGIDNGAAKFDLSIEFEARASGLIGRIEYRTDLFEAATIERMMGHFQTVLAGIVANPFARISELPLPTESLGKPALAPNGEIDRKAPSRLPLNSEPLSGKGFIAPRTSIEKLLSDIWRQVLGTGRISIHDNFFELGGHSLQALQLISRIASASNIRISVKQLFSYPTLAQLANLIEQSNHSPSKAGHPMVRPENNPTGENIFQPSPHFQLERRSLCSLLLAGKIPPVTAAALGYLPDAILEQSDSSREEIREQWFDNLPLVAGITETAWGRIALLLLPRFHSELYGDTDDIVGVILDALEIAGKIGAGIVSLTGIIPSATDYGRAISAAVGDRPHLPRITTGHSTTAAAVVLSIRKILQESGRSMGTEQVGVIGLGSIGLSSLRLMLRCLPHPVELILCDIYARKGFLEKIRDRIIHESSFRGQIRLFFPNASFPERFTRPLS